MRLWYLSHRQPAELSLFAHMKYESRRRSDQKSDLPHKMSMHAWLKNEFTEDKKNHNLTTWLNCCWARHDSSIRSVSAWHASGPKFDPHVQHILSWRLGHKQISTTILPLPLIQEQKRGRWNGRQSKLNASGQHGIPYQNVVSLKLSVRVYCSKPSIHIYIFTRIQKVDLFWVRICNKLLFSNQK